MFTLCECLNTLATVRLCEDTFVHALTRVCFRVCLFETHPALYTTHPPRYPCRVFLRLCTSLSAALPLHRKPPTVKLSELNKHNVEDETPVV